MEAGINERVTLEDLVGTLCRKDLYKLYSEQQVHGQVMLLPVVNQRSGHQLSKPLTSSGQKSTAHGPMLATDSQTNPILICDICDDQFASKHDMIMHIYNHEDLDYFCTKCEETYCDEETFREHKEGCKKLFDWTTGNADVAEKAKGPEISSRSLISSETEEDPFSFNAIKDEIKDEIKEEIDLEHSLLNTLPTNCTMVNAGQGNYPQCSPAITREVILTNTENGPECYQFNLNTKMHDVIVTEKEIGPECSLVDNHTIPGDDNETDKASKCSTYDMNAKINYVFIMSDNEGPECSLSNNNATHGPFITEKDKGLEFSHFNINTKNIMTRNKKGPESKVIHKNTNHGDLASEKDTGVDCDYFNTKTKKKYVVIGKKSKSPECSLFTDDVSYGGIDTEKDIEQGPECSLLENDTTDGAFLTEEDEGVDLDDPNQFNMIAKSHHIFITRNKNGPECSLLKNNTHDGAFVNEKDKGLESSHLNKNAKNHYVFISRNKNDPERSLLKNNTHDGAFVNEKDKGLERNQINMNTKIHEVITRKEIVLDASPISHAVITETGPKHQINMSAATENFLINNKGIDHSSININTTCGVVINEKEKEPKCSENNMNAMAPAVIKKEKETDEGVHFKQEPVDQVDIVKEPSIIGVNNIIEPICSTELQDLVALAEKMLNAPIKLEGEIKEEVLEPATEHQNSFPADNGLATSNSSMMESSEIRTVVGGNQYILQQNNIGNDIETNSLVFAKHNNKSDTQNNNSCVSKLPASPSLIAQNSVDIEQESHQDVMEDLMVRDILHDDEVDVAEELPDGNTARSLEQPRIPSQQIVEEPPKQWYCGECNKHFCTQSILTLHHRFHHKLQLCLCNVCNTSIQPTLNTLKGLITNKNHERVNVQRQLCTEKLNTKLLKYVDPNERKMAIQHTQTMTRDNEAHYRMSRGMLQTAPNIDNHNSRQNHFSKKKHQKNMLLKRLGISRTAISNPSVKQNNLILKSNRCVSQLKGMPKDSTDAEQKWFSKQRDFLAENWGMSKTSIDKILQKKMLMERLAKTSTQRLRIRRSEKGGMSRAGIDNLSQTAVATVDNIKKGEVIEIYSDSEMEIETLDYLEYGLDSDQNMDLEFQRNTEYAAPSGHLRHVYSCSVCLNKFSARGELADHMRTHTTVSDKPYICNICSKPFRKSKYLKSHLEIHDTEKRKCPNCSRQFNSTGSMARHKQYFCKAKTNTERYACNRCNKEYCTRTTMNIHKKFYCYDRTQPMPYECDICNNRYPELDILNFHKKRHGHIFTCDYCKRNFGNRYHLQRHLLVHTGLKPYKCEVCEKCYARKCGLDNHLVSHTNTKFTCDACGKNFFGKESLKRHKHVMCNEKVFRDKPFVCDVCKKRFANKTAIARHITKNHLKRFDCDICDKSFGLRCNLVTHIELHCGRKMHCAVCKRVFTRECDLLYHERMHPGGDRQYFCDTCDKRFIHESTMLYHNIICRRKSKANKHHCDICNRNFADKTIWSRHKEICKEMIKRNRCQCDVCKRWYQTKRAIANHITKCHSKKFICDVCNKTFGEKRNLVCHIRTGHGRGKSLSKYKIYHSGAKKYSCGTCKQKFRLKSSLICHNKRHRTGKNEYSCLKCHEKFTFKYALTHHMQQDCKVKEEKGNKKIVERHKRIVEKNKKVMEGSKKIVEANKKIVETKMEPNNNINKKPLTKNNKRSKKIVAKDKKIVEGNKKIVETKNKINKKPVTRNSKGSKKIVTKYISCLTCNARFTDKYVLAYHKLHRCGKGRCHRP